jgi:hypothetical protein
MRGVNDDAFLDRVAERIGWANDNNLLTVTIGVRQRRLQYRRVRTRRAIKLNAMAALKR